jgi:hypothetical protein
MNFQVPILTEIGQERNLDLPLEYELHRFYLMTPC